MNLQAFARPGVEVSAEAMFLRAFEHLDTAIDHDDPAPIAPFGFTLWRSSDLQLGWDWIAQDGIVMLFAPLSIVTNAVVLGSDGVPLPDRELTLFLNAVVHRLPWQAVIRAQLSKATDATPVRVTAAAPSKHSAAVFN